VTLPLKTSYAPMEARLVDALPTGAEWQYEPKWDGFRCVAYRDGDTIELMSKAGKPLARYFPDLVEVLATVKATRFVLDGEIVIPNEGSLSFDELLLRIHPANSRVLKLANTRRRSSCSTCWSMRREGHSSGSRCRSGDRRSRRSSPRTCGPPNAPAFDCRPRPRRW
jgi:hypothetical protein